MPRCAAMVSLGLVLVVGKNEPIERESKQAKTKNSNYRITKVPDISKDIGNIAKIKAKEKWDLPNLGEVGSSLISDVASV